MRKLFAPLLIVVALVSLAGCSAPPLTGFSFELLKLERAADGSVTATMRLNNPNVVAYNVETSTHTVFLDGKLAGTISVTRPEGVPPTTAVNETAPFTPAAGYALSNGSASYRMESNVTLLLYGEAKEKQKLAGSGTVEISVK